MADSRIRLHSRSERPDFFHSVTNSGATASSIFGPGSSPFSDPLNSRVPLSRSAIPSICTRSAQIPCALPVNRSWRVPSTGSMSISTSRNTTGKGWCNCSPSPALSGPFRTSSNDPRTTWMVGTLPIDFMGQGLAKSESKFHFPEPSRANRKAGWATTTF